MYEGKGFCFRTIFVAFLLAISLLILSSCGGDGGSPTDPIDIPDPVAVTDLRVTAGAENVVELTWTSPQLADKADPVISYELRFTAFQPDLLSALSWPMAPAPLADSTSGISHIHTVTGLPQGSVHVFALRCKTQENSWSGFSNYVVGTASEQWDTTPPSSITDLQFWSSSGENLTVYWSHVGGDGTLGQASGYEIRYSTSGIDETNWEDATLATGEAENGPFEGTLQTTLTGLQNGQSYHLAARAYDQAGNWSALTDNLVTEVGQGSTWLVTVDGSGDRPSIQTAIDQAGPGDVILVGPGRYTWTNQETDSFYGLVFFVRDRTDITLRSQLGPELTILDAEEQGGVIHLQGYNDVTIEGFTITGGRVEGDPEDEEPYAGGGITSHLANPLVRNCIITGNRATEGGGVWLGSTSQPRLEDCIIENNYALMGGGIALVNDALHIQIEDCIIRDNEAAIAGGGMMAYNTFFTFEDCLLVGNTSGNKGGAMSLINVHEDCVVTGCSIIGNDADLGSAIRLYDQSVLTIESTLIAFNTGGPAFSEELSGGLIMGCSNVFGHDEGQDPPTIFMDLGGNFSADPLLCDLTEGFYLQPDSPCAPGNHPDSENCGLVGARPVGCTGN